jgi:hypothetical protein
MDAEPLAGPLGFDDFREEEPRVLRLARGARDWEAPALDRREKAAGERGGA